MCPSGPRPTLADLTPKYLTLVATSPGWYRLKVVCEVGVLPSAALRGQEQKWARVPRRGAWGRPARADHAVRAHFERQDPRLHRHLEHLPTATLRDLGAGLDDN